MIISELHNIKQKIEDLALDVRNTTRDTASETAHGGISDASEKSILHFSGGQGTSRAQADKDTVDEDEDAERDDEGMGDDGRV
jgi:hypothetical protein